MIHIYYHQNDEMKRKAARREFPAFIGENNIFVSVNVYT